MTVYVNETEFYRQVLGISYELGAKLRRLHVLTPDAEMKDGRPLFILSAESISAHEDEINRYQHTKRKRPWAKPIV